jgi:FkbM family methyltransferase
MRIEINPQSIFERGLYFRNGEPDTYDFLRRELRPGMIFADCGANIGFYSLVGSTQVGEAGRVYSFEPTPNTFSRLQRNIGLNGMLNIRPFRLALGHRAGRAGIFGESLEGHQLNFVSQDIHQAVSLGSCEVDSIDALIASGTMLPPDLMKIDVEGSELPLLRGAEALLRRTPSPVLCVELCRANMDRFGYEPEDVVKYLGSLRRYRIEWPFLGRRIAVEPDEPLPHYARMGRAHAANYVFWPEAA